MALYASKILKLVVDEFWDRSVSEIRFVSGLNPSIVKKDGPHFLEFGDLSCERVGEIHELCRLVADEPVEESEMASTYTFVLRHFGRVVCRYMRHGKAASLILVRDADEAETVDAIHPMTHPSLRAEAKPEPGLEQAREQEQEQQLKGH